MKTKFVLGLPRAKQVGLEHAKKPKEVSDFEGKIRSESKIPNKKLVDSHQRNPQPSDARSWR